MHAVIAGAGMGGLATALALHELGWRVTVCDSVRALKPLGAGINILPHGVEILESLGLLDAVLDSGVATRAVEYRSRFGHLLSSDPRGVEAGFSHPQVSIHRGSFQKLMHDALIDRAGADAVHMGHRLVSATQDQTQVTAVFATADGPVPISGDILIGADGFHSALRRCLHPTEGPAQAEGVTMYRGVHRQAPFGDGRTMIIAGNHDRKFVCYPVTDTAPDTGTCLLNWVAEVRGSDPRPASEADWNREADREFIAQFQDFALDGLDIPALLSATQSITTYPMIDRDPLDTWGTGRMTLLGDAAHPMYPIGANGTSQALMDVDALRRALLAHADPATALRTYETERLPATAEVVRANRRSGPEKVLDIADARLKGADDRVEDLINPTESAEVAAQYRKVAGFQKVKDR
jgi:2-polyprenyl-6-methoxyphenol hydroxylase-like FAD-dependent oxidoreductase